MALLERLLQVLPPPPTLERLLPSTPAVAGPAAPSPLPPRPPLPAGASPSLCPLLPLHVPPVGFRSEGHSGSVHSQSSLARPQMDVAQRVTVVAHLKLCSPFWHLRSLMGNSRDYLL